LTTLLAVDDSNTMRKVLEITFAGEDDLEVVLASGSGDAMALLNERRPGVALVDVTLSPTDGYALCQQIKQAAPGTQVLLLSSKQNPYDPSRGAAAGADDHVDKPFDTQALIERVRTLIERAPVAAVDNVPAYPVRAVIEPKPVVQEPPAYQRRLEPVLAEPPAAELEIVPDSEPPPAPEPSTPPPPPPPSTAPIQVSTADAEALAAATVRPSDKAPSNGSSNGLSALGGRLSDLGLTSEQVSAVLALSREVIEQAVWEVVPTLAETLIKEEIARLTRE
jgi:CheY-like chemotaxis protein